MVRVPISDFLLPPSFIQIIHQGQTAGSRGATSDVDTFRASALGATADRWPTRRSGYVRYDFLKRPSLLICPCRVLFAKVFLFSLPQITSRTFRVTLPLEGVSRSSRTRGGMRWTRQRFARDGIAGRVERLVSDQQHADERRLLRTAKSCGPDAPTLASSSRRHVGPTGHGQAHIR